MALLVVFLSLHPAMAGRLRAIIQDLEGAKDCGDRLRGLGFSEGRGIVRNVHYREYKDGFVLRSLGWKDLAQVQEAFGCDPEYGLLLSLIENSAKQGDKIAPGSVLALGWYFGAELQGIGMLLITQAPFVRAMPGIHEKSKWAEILVYISPKSRRGGEDKRLLAALEDISYFVLGFDRLYACIPAIDAGAVSFMKAAEGWGLLYTEPLRVPESAAPRWFFVKSKPEQPPIGSGYLPALLRRDSADAFPSQLRERLLELRVSLFPFERREVLIAEALKGSPAGQAVLKNMSHEVAELYFKQIADPDAAAIVDILTKMTFHDTSELLTEEIRMSRLRKLPEGDPRRLRINFEIANRLHPGLMEDLERARFNVFRLREILQRNPQIYGHGLSRRELEIVAQQISDSSKAAVPLNEVLKGFLNP